MTDIIHGKMFSCAYFRIDMGTSRRAQVAMRCARIAVLTVIILLPVTCKLSVAFNNSEYLLLVSMHCCVNNLVFSRLGDSFIKDG